MGTITIKIDDELKDEAYQALEALNMSPSELLHQTLVYVAQHHKLPFSDDFSQDEDEYLVEIVRQRLQDPKPIAVNL